MVWNGINSSVYYLDYSGTLDMHLSSTLKNILNDKYEDFQRQIQEELFKKQNKIDFRSEQNLDRDCKQINIKKILPKI